GSKVRDYTLLYNGLKQLARTMDLEVALDVLEGNLQNHVAEWARNRVFVHAGAVAWKGKAIVLPGRSMTGKSTLVAALLRAGAASYSGEFAVLDARGFAPPFSRPLSRRRPEGEPPRRCTAEELGSRPGTEPLPVGIVALARYQAGASWRPRSLTPGQAILGLMNNTVPAEREPEMALSALEKIAPHARSLTGVRGEAEETAAALLQEAER